MFSNVRYVTVLFTCMLTSVTGTVTGTGSGHTTGLETAATDLGAMGLSGGCEYKGINYSVGAVWEDGCAYTCTCVDGQTGYYTCVDTCLNWQLPSACHLDPPAAGKCCPTPNCPVGYTLNYPAG